MLEKTSQNQTRNLQNAMSLSGEADRRQVKIVRISSLTPPPFTVNSYLGNTARVLVRDVREWSGSCVETSAQDWAKVVMQTWAGVARYLCFDGMISVHRRDAPLNASNHTWPVRLQDIYPSGGSMLAQRLQCCANMHATLGEVDHLILFR